MTTPPVIPFHVLGLDLGQSADFTALCLLEVTGDKMAVRNLKRYALGTSYPSIVSDVCAKFARAPLAGKAALVIDASGVGRPVVDLFSQEKEAGRLLAASVVAVTITGGNSETMERDRGVEYHRVAKRILVSSLQVPLQAGRLSIAEQPLAQALGAELQNFQVRINDNANDIYSAREGQHDDLVLATALAVWSASRPVRQFSWA